MWKMNLPTWLLKIRFVVIHMLQFELQAVLLLTAGAGLLLASDLVSLNMLKEAKLARRISITCGAALAAIWLAGKILS